MPKVAKLFSCSFRNCPAQNKSNTAEFKKIHAEMHKFDCEACKLIFKSQSELENHVKKAHRIRCRVGKCKKVFKKDKFGLQHTFESSLATHFKEKHPLLDYKKYLFIEK